MIQCSADAILASILADSGAEVAKLSNRPVKNVATAFDLTDDCLCYLGHRYLEKFDGENLDRLAFLITDSECWDKFVGLDGDFTLVIVDNPRLVFTKVLTSLFAENKVYEIHPTAVIHPNALIGRNVHIGAYSVISDDCEIGDSTVIATHCAIDRGTKIGKNCHIGSNTCIGGDGFGYERLEDNQLLFIPHIGGVEIGENVRIGANTAIARGTLGSTKIGSGSRIDNLCHISHNVEIGENCAVIAHAMIGGSCKIGDNSWIGPGTLVRDTVQICNDAYVGIGANVVGHIRRPGVYAGSPAKGIESFKEEREAIKRLIKHAGDFSE